MDEIVICNECGVSYATRWIRRHLVRNHGYRYTDSSPNIPVKVKKKSLLCEQIQEDIALLEQNIIPRKGE